MGLISIDAFNRLITAGDYRAVLALFDEDPSEVRRLLTRLTYTRQTILHANALVAFSLLSEERSEQEPGFFTETIRRHLWGMNEEGGNIDWSAPEIIGAIIAGNIKRFSSYVPILYNTAVSEPILHQSLIAALELIATVEPEPALTFLSEMQDA